MNKSNKFIMVIKPDVPNGFMCVYQIKFGNLYSYIGSTTCLNQRIKEHMGSIKKGFVNNTIPICIDSRCNIHVEILEVTNKLKEREEFFINSIRIKQRLLNRRLPLKNNLI